MANSKLDEQLEYRDDLNAKINNLEKKLDLIIDNLIRRNQISNEIDSSKSSGIEDVFTKVDNINKQMDSIFQTEQSSCNEKKPNQYPNSKVIIFEVVDAKKNWKTK